MQSHPTPDPSAPDDTARHAEALIHARRTVLPKRLQAPGPDSTQQHAILNAAGAAPDHGQKLPWRLIEVTQNKRHALADAFAQALLERDASASNTEVAQAREKAHRAPWLLLAVARLSEADGDTDPLDERFIPPHERLISAGCAIQNMLLMATALGFGSALTSGKALESHALRTLFGLSEHEQALCFVNIGTVSEAKPGKPRPQVSDYFSRLE